MHPGAAGRRRPRRLPGRRLRGLAASGAAPDWVAGISIGAINAALIAGNPPERRVARLREFWERVSSSRSARPVPARRPTTRARTRPRQRDQCDDRHAVRRAPASSRRACRRRRSSRRARSAAISYYDTEPLRAHARAAGRLRSAQLPARCGCRSARSTSRRGNFVYFDSAQQRLDARHIMASGALPPGLSADRDRRRVLLGRRPGLEHAAAVRARPAEPPAAPRLPGRPVRRPRRDAGATWPRRASARRTSATRAGRA